MDDDSIFVTEVDFDECETEIRAILEEYVTWLERLVQEAVGADYATDFDTVLESDLARFRAPEETTVPFLARSEDHPVGFVYLLGRSRTTAVMKRLYVRPAYRRRGIGRSLVAELVETAAERGYTTLLLTTSPGMDAAQELYADLGFEETEPFETEVPEEFHDICRFMRRSLRVEE